MCTPAVHTEVVVVAAGRTHSVRGLRHITFWVTRCGCRAMDSQAILAIQCTRDPQHSEPALNSGRRVCGLAQGFVSHVTDCTARSGSRIPHQHAFCECSRTAMAASGNGLCAMNSLDDCGEMRCVDAPCTIERNPAVAQTFQRDELHLRLRTFWKTEAHVNPGVESHCTRRTCFARGSSMPSSCVIDTSGGLGNPVDCIEALVGTWQPVATIETVEAGTLKDRCTLQPSWLRCGSKALIGRKKFRRSLANTNSFNQALEQLKTHVIRNHPSVVLPAAALQTS